ncbi:MAG: PBP1A family penicillin-binding protein [Candidatus Daviesbacteria bacterium]|nr:PBP1A family penicillin-binding protein [Candidatus Daviesbacteria bacterium]
MPKIRAATNLRPSLPKVALLLSQFILIKIGQIPLFTVISTISIWKLLFSFTNFSLRRVGRPRKKPIYTVYARKIGAAFRHTPKKYKLITFFLILILSIYAYTTFILAAAYQLPTPEKLSTPLNPLTTTIYDRNGELLYRLYEGRNRTLIELEDLPKHLIWATLAVEDKNFYHHPGFDISAIIRAAYNNLAYGKREGASTITQQLIKNTLLTSEQTISRKVKEIILAFWAERVYSKDEILKMYFNEAPYGGPAWGIEAAAQTYFGKGARDLTLPEASFLAGLPASPTQFSPYGTNPQLAKSRQNYVLQRMVDDGYITQAQSDAAYSDELIITPPTNNINAPHFVMYVKDLLSQRYGPRLVSQGGLKVFTTLDMNLQRKVEEIVASEVFKIESLKVSNGAAMVTDSKSGQILAMVGSKDYHEPQFGSYNVTLSLRQPGSSIKPATYATAFKLGYSPGNTILDLPITFKDIWGNKYSPVNYDGKFRGPTSIRVALGSSYNIPAVRMLATVGIEEMIATARDLGITTFTEPEKYGLSLTLGGGAVKMIDMMTMYGTFSQMGKKILPTPILRVTDANGHIIEEYEARPTQVITPAVAYLITDILSDNKARIPAFGANSLLKIPQHSVAVKTGTSDDKRDNWTFGYTPEYVVGVWVGNNDNSPMHPSLTSGITGASPIWNKIMTLILDGRKDLAFERPQEVVETLIDGRKDLAIADKLPKSLVRMARKDDQLILSDSFSSYATSSAQAAVPEL